MNVNMSLVTLILNMCTGLTFTNKTFESLNEAYDYCANNAKKWGDALAAQFKTSNKIKESAKLKRLKEQRLKIEEEIRLLRTEKASHVESKLKAVEFIKCSHCKSQLDTRFRTRTLRCPICDGSFASNTYTNKEQSLNNKLALVNKKISDEAKVLQKKADKNSRELRWLVYGVCSS